MADHQSTDETILIAAGALLDSAGPEGVTTRAVCAAAGVTAPTLYHHFGDKKGLLDAVVNRGIQDFIATKKATRDSVDAFDDLRNGWNRLTEFSLKRPWLFKLMVERINQSPELAGEAYAVMRRRLARLGAEGRLTVDVTAAARAMQAASNGVMALYSQGASRAEIETTSTLLFEAVTSRLIR